MGRELTAPDREKRKRILLIAATAAAIAAFVLSLVFIARINGWLYSKNEIELLTIVDSETPVGEYDQTLTMFDDEHMIDSRCAAELEKMLADCRAAGCEPVVTAAFLSENEQRELFNSIVEGYIASGFDEDTAKRLAELETAKPGHSEHQLGLAVDIADASASDTAAAQAASKTNRWLCENSWKYGFILRYPEGGGAITGRGFVPTHFRYVGPEAAEQIHELDVTLEEYVKMFYS